MCGDIDGGSRRRSVEDLEVKRRKEEWGQLVSPSVLRVVVRLKKTTAFGLSRPVNQSEIQKTCSNKMFSSIWNPNHSKFPSPPIF